MSFERGVLLVVGLALSGCMEWPRPSEGRLDRDEKRYPKLSAGRGLGSPCGPNDGATIRRATRHPLGPTGSWNGVAVLEAGRSVDPSLLKPFGSAVAVALMPVGAVYAGYVQAGVAGTLRARTYDDVYGEVYGGWSPSTLDVSPTPAPVFVALGRSVYGDGGLRQVHEVCWTSKGSADGVVVFSTAHEPSRPPFERRQVFRPDDLGGTGFVDTTLAAQLFDEHLRAGDGPAARALVGELERRLGRLPGAVDGTTGAPIPSRAFHAEAWADLLAVKAGLSVGTPGFGSAADELERLVALASGAPSCLGCEAHRGMLPLFRWLDASARGGQAAVPDPARLPRGPVGHDPSAIARGLLGRRSAAVPAMLDATAGFWSGARALTAGDRDAARAAFETFLRASPRPVANFEGGAATALLESLRAQPSP
jgi:hypothetical protein